MAEGGFGHEPGARAHRRGRRPDLPTVECLRVRRGRRRRRDERRRRTGHAAPRPDVVAHTHRQRSPAGRGRRRVAPASLAPQSRLELAGGRTRRPRRRQARFDCPVVAGPPGRTLPGASPSASRSVVRRRESLFTRDARLVSTLLCRGRQTSPTADVSLGGCHRGRGSAGPSSPSGPRSRTASGSPVAAPDAGTTRAALGLRRGRCSSGCVRRADDGVLGDYGGSTGSCSVVPHVVPVADARAPVPPDLAHRHGSRHGSDVERASGSGCVGSVATANARRQRAQRVSRAGRPARRAP